jgi:hypothetical protein
MGTQNSLAAADPCPTCLAWRRLLVAWVVIAGVLGGRLLHAPSSRIACPRHLPSGRQLPSPFERSIGVNHETV